MGEKPRPKPDDLRPGPAFDRNNPGASYNAMLAPFGGFALKGIIFNQGYKKVEVHSPSVSEPKAVRYAWARWATLQTAPTTNASSRSRHSARTTSSLPQLEFRVEPFELDSGIVG